MPVDNERGSKPFLVLEQGTGHSMTALCALYLQEYASKIRVGVEALNEDQFWWRPAEGTNSLGNLVLHLAGNLSVWVLREVGDIPFERDRDGEFAARSGDRATTLARLETVVAQCVEVLERLPLERLSEARTIQGYTVDVAGAVFHATEHMAYHTGQILSLAKQLMRDASTFDLYGHLKGSPDDRDASSPRR